MFIKGATFNEYIAELDLARAEGLLLRYISQTYKGMAQSVEEKYKNDEVLDIIAYLRTMLSRVDTSLIEEWESLFLAKEEEVETSEKRALSPYDPRVNYKAFVAKLRSELFHLVRLLSIKNYTEAELAINNSGDDAWNEERFEQALKGFYEISPKIIADPRARNPVHTKINKVSDTEYEVTHTLLDEQDDSWHLNITVDLKERRDESAPLLFLKSIEE